MKTQLLILFSLCVIIPELYGQGDPQWLISNSRGKSGYNSTTGNAYNNTLGPNFVLNRVSAPSSSNINAQNDLLVIFRDGSNFHSRGQSIPGPFFRSNSASVGFVHTFTNLHTSPVYYMYLSNRY